MNDEQRELVPNTCSIFYRCSSPICPLCLTGDELWFPDEPYCSKHNMADNFQFIKVQRKLAKKHKESHDAGFFTVEMLNKIARVSRSTTGRDPDIPQKPSKFERKLLRHNAPPNKMTQERMDALRRYRTSKNDSGGTISEQK